MSYAGVENMPTVVQFFFNMNVSGQSKNAFVGILKYSNCFLSLDILSDVDNRKQFINHSKDFSKWKFLGL